MKPPGAIPGASYPGDEISTPDSLEADNRPPMQTHNPGPVQTKGIRPALWGGLLIATGLVILGAILYSRQAAMPTPTEESVADNPAAADLPQVQEDAPAEPATADGLAAKSNDVPDPASNLADWIRILKDAAQPIAARIQAARTLASAGSDEAVAALKAVLPAAPDELRAAIAEALGKCPHPESLTMLLGLLVDQSEAVVLAAVRGLAGQDSPQALEALSRLLYDPTKLMSIRCEAAAALARMRQPGAMEALGRVAAQINDEAILSHLLDSAANRPISETGVFFRNYLQAPTVSTDLKVTALENLGQSPGDVGSFLAEYLGNPDAEIRQAAAWALSTADEPGALTDQLIPMLQNETDAEVRERLYQALANQENVDWQSILPALQQENDLNARLAGFDLLAGLLRNGTIANTASPQQLAYFDQTVVPELKNTALSGTPFIRKRALIALNRAGTPAALEAVQAINQQPAEPAAEHAPKQKNK